jgi:hypothetical protein
LVLVVQPRLVQLVALALHQLLVETLLAFLAVAVATVLTLEASNFQHIRAVREAVGQAVQHSVLVPLAWAAMVAHQTQAPLAVAAVALVLLGQTVLVRLAVLVVLVTMSAHSFQVQHSLRLAAVAAAAHHQVAQAVHR